MQLLEPRRLLSAGGVSDDVSAQDAPPGTLTNVYVSGAAWSQPFKQYLKDNYLGSSPEYGWGIHGGGTPHRDHVLPWINLNRVSVMFTTVVRAEPDDLRIRGVNADYQPTSVSVDAAPDGATSVATWTLSRPLAADKFIVEVEGDAGGVTHNPTGLLDLDGDGVLGGDFTLRLNVLPGDVLPDGVVFPTEPVVIRTLLDRSINKPGAAPWRYASWDDVDGSGRIDVRDLVAVRSRVYTYLPRTEPAASAPTVVASLSRNPPITRSLFSSVHMLA